MENVNDFRDSALQAFPRSNWFALGIDVYKLAGLFPLDAPRVDNYNKDVVEKLESLIDPDDRWPYDVDMVPHAADDAYITSEIEQADRDRNSRKFLRLYRKYILHTVEDAIALLCVKTLSIMGRYDKTTGDPVPAYRDDEREKAFLEVFGEKKDRDICDFLRRKLRDILRNECKSVEKNKESDFNYVLSFLFSFAIRLGIKNIEWYIQKRIDFELMRAAEKLLKKKRPRINKRRK